MYKGKQLSVIITVQDEEKTIGNVIEELRKIEPFEIIVVVNGSSDQTATIAKDKGATTIVYKEALEMMWGAYLERILQKEKLCYL